MNQKILFFLSDFSWDVKNQKSQDLEGPFAFAKLWRLHFELNAMRQIRAGNLHYIGRRGEKDWDWVHDPKNDHGPETLFDLAMEAVANHPRVHEWVGTKVLPKAEPDKAVYRMHEGWVVQEQTRFDWYLCRCVLCV